MKRPVDKLLDDIIQAAEVAEEVRASMPDIP